MATACSGWDDFADPPAELEGTDLVGLWETSYGRYSRDRLELRADGTFKQRYEVDTPAEEPYVFETPWNEWHLEHLSDGRVRLHLAGARYFAAGRPPKGRLWDPFAWEEVLPKRYLVLNVRVLNGFEYVLYHMWTTHDRGFSLFGGESLFFRRRDVP